jgi:hypothetical protein
MLMAANTPPAFIYQHPGADPYRGTNEKALRLLYPSARPYLPYSVFARIETNGFCRLRFFQQGELVNAMVYGKARVATNVLVDVNDWPSSASRLVSECTDGLGNAIGVPVVCGNIFYERISPFPAWNTPPYGQNWSAENLPESEGESPSDFGEGDLSSGLNSLGLGNELANNNNNQNNSLQNSSQNSSSNNELFSQAPSSELISFETPVTPSSSPNSSTPEPSSIAIFLIALTFLLTITFKQKV